MKKKTILVFLSMLFFFSTKISAQTLYTSYIFNGSIGNNPIILTFLVPDHFYNYDQGSYYYTKNKRKIEFRGQDMAEIGEDGIQKLTESVNGKNTGYFVFNNLDVLESKKIEGKWFTMDGKTVYPVVLRLAKIK